MSDDRCPHCQRSADIDRAEVVRFVCHVCGGIRIPIDDDTVERSAEQVDLLKKATVARSAQTIWAALGISIAGFGIFSVVVLALVINVAHPVVLGSAVGALAAAAPFGFGVYAFMRSRARGSEVAPLLDRAWEVAAADIARANGGELDAAALARVTRTSTELTSTLIARTSAGKKAKASDAPSGARNDALPGNQAEGRDG
ncbi:MAG TPA: hypothetical protein VJT73_14125 [Polyangiaceae bacterium]|nr:hypothetical protein [Polyangiaceae bacterium]